MPTTNTPHVPLPSPREMIRGTAEFLRVLKSKKTRNGMAAEVVRTLRSGISHNDLNEKQYSLLSEYAERGEKPKYIAVLVPGFQLDGTSLLGFQKTFNEQGIPAFFPSRLPYGRDAVTFGQHPEVLVERIVKYVQEVQAVYPEAEILLIGHSYGGTQVLHASHELGKKKGKVTPITVAGVLGEVGPMAQAIHAILYRIPSHVFSGKDGFIDEARKIQARGVGLTVVDTDDGYLPTHVQAGVHADNLGHQNLVVSDIQSPGHYKQGVDAYFSRYIAGRVLERLKERGTVSTQQ